MTEFEWKPTRVHFYLADKAVALSLEDPERYPNCLSITNPGFELGFVNTLSYERARQKNYQFDHEGLVLRPEDPDYVLEAARFEKEQTFADYSWKSTGKTVRRVDPARFETAEAFRFEPNHPYKGSIDSVLKFGTVSKEGDCGPSTFFEAFFYQGRLVAGTNGEVNLETAKDLATALNISGNMPHPSEQQVKEFLLKSNLEKTLLNRFEEFLTL